MKKRSGSYPRVRVEGDGRAAVSRAGAVLLVETVRKSGLDAALSAALAPWRKPRAVHDPGKVLLDVALAVALGGDCLADVGVPRAEPAVFGPVASDPTVSRLVDTLAGAGPKALTAIRAARAQVSARVWELAGPSGPAADGQVTVDMDGVLVLAHSEKQDAAPTWKKTFGHHPLVAFVDHGEAGSGEPVAALLRPGNAGSNTAADHITVTRPARTIASANIRLLALHQQSDARGEPLLEQRLSAEGQAHQGADQGSAQGRHGLQVLRETRDRPG